MGLKGIGLNFECIGSVFKIIRLLMSGAGKFAWFANQNGAASKGIGESRAKDKTAGFDPGNQVDTVVLVMGF